MKFKFYKVFTKGLLRGLTIEDNITYQTKSGFDGWVEAINKKHKSGKNPYYVKLSVNSDNIVVKR